MEVKGIVYVDGANSVGKTTLSNELVKRFGAVVLHQTYRFTKNIFHYHTAVIKKALEISKDRLVILDRHWMSESAYAHVYRGGTPWPYQGRMVHRLFLAKGVVTAVCYDPDEWALRSRFEEQARIRNRTGSDIGGSSSIKSDNNARLNRIFFQGPDSELTGTYLDKFLGIGHNAVMCRFGHIDESVDNIKKRLDAQASLVSHFDCNAFARVILASSLPLSKNELVPFYGTDSQSVWVANNLENGVSLLESDLAWSTPEIAKKLASSTKAAVIDVTKVVESRDHEAFHSIKSDVCLLRRHLD